MHRPDFKRVSKAGVTVILINKKRILIVKRIWFPFISHPGMWYVIGGAQERGERMVDTAFREIGEETKIQRKDLALRHSSKIEIFDAKRKQRWTNDLFVIESKSDKVRLNIEHRAYRWVTLAQFEEYKELMAALGNAPALLGTVDKIMKGKY